MSPLHDSMPIIEPLRALRGIAILSGTPASAEAEAMMSIQALQQTAAALRFFGVFCLTSGRRG